MVLAFAPATEPEPVAAPPPPTPDHVKSVVDDVYARHEAKRETIQAENKIRGRLRVCLDVLKTADSDFAPVIDGLYTTDRHVPRHVSKEELCAELENFLDKLAENASTMCPKPKPKDDAGPLAFDESKVDAPTPLEEAFGFTILDPAHEMNSKAGPTRISYDLRRTVSEELSDDSPVVADMKNRILEPAHPPKDQKDQTVPPPPGPRLSGRAGYTFDSSPLFTYLGNDENDQTIDEMISKYNAKIASACGLTCQRQPTANSDPNEIPVSLRPYNKNAPCGSSSYSRPDNAVLTLTPPEQ